MHRQFVHLRHGPLLRGAVAVIIAAAGAAWLGAPDRTARATPVPEAPSQQSPRAVAPSPVPSPSVTPRGPSASHRALAVRTLPVEPTSSTPAASRESTPDREVRRLRAERELEQLRRQNARSFLAVFDMIAARDGGTSDLRPLRVTTERYISTRLALLERMQARFIEDQDAEHQRELEELELLDRDFRRQLDWHAKAAPEVANFDEILTTTVLKLPSFIAPSEVELSREQSPTAPSSENHTPEIIITTERNP